MNVNMILMAFIFRHIDFNMTTSLYLYAQAGIFKASFVPDQLPLLTAELQAISHLVLSKTQLSGKH